MVKILHLYENVQNRLQNKKKFDGVRKLVLKHFSGKIQNDRHEITKVSIFSSIIETRLFYQTICFWYQGMQ